MRNSIFTTVLACLLTTAMAQTAAAQDSDGTGTRLAQTGLNFLSVSVDARAAAMGDAMAAQDGQSVSMFYNPAGMASMQGFSHISLGQVQWLGNSKFQYASAAFRPARGMYGTIGFFLTSVDYGDFIGTIRADNASGYVDTGDFGPSAMAFGVGYAANLSDRFAIGANLKYARQALGESVMSVDGGEMQWQDNTLGTPAVDFGILYRTGFESLTFAFTTRNFSQEVTYAEESLELPLTFQLGISMDLADLTQINSENHSFVMSVAAERPRDYLEQVKVGGEYVFMNLLALRAGYVYPTDEQGVNLGAGIQTAISGASFGFDYAYSQFGVFGNVNRLALHVGF